MEETIKSTAVEHLKSLLGDKVEIIDLIVKNGWLVATLKHGTTFSVKNE